MLIAEAISVFSIAETPICLELGLVGIKVHAVHRRLLNGAAGARRATWLEQLRVDSACVWYDYQDPSNQKS